MKDPARRRRVMRRSMRLGHCICNAKKACPCDLFREKDVCACAGERADVPPGPVRLTSLVENAGCASKIDQATLRRVLDGLPSLDDPRVLIGAAAGDDAGVYKIDDQLALVQTVDVFSPSVDDPYQFGQIAAANSLSDVYAMGGRPVSALSIVGFPIHSVSEDVLREILRGGIDKMTEAEVPVIGGHSIDDREIKAGFAVTGVIHPDKILSNAQAQPGDCLILTKPLGTGVLAFAMQIGRAPAGSAEAAARSMAQLNRYAANVMRDVEVHACTDITGFGLMGHLGAMASASGVAMEIVWDDLPLLPGVLECLAQGIASGALERNRESSGHCLIADDKVSPAMVDLCFDPQTSGGLLIALPQAAATALLTRLHDEGMAEAAVIGRVLGGLPHVSSDENGTCPFDVAGSQPGRVHVRTTGRRAIPTDPSSTFHADRADRPQEVPSMNCCEGGHEAAAAGDVPGIQKKFQEFLAAASAPGTLDGKTKQAITIALCVLARCEPCLKSHLKKARAMGFTQDEIDEAAWVAIAFGGSPAMVFYSSLRTL